MRLAFIDLIFSWPPHGGADVDLFHVIQELQASGHDCHLFGVRDPASWERGVFEPQSLPFPATRLDVQPGDVDAERLPQRLREEVDAWAPDSVFVCGSYFLKPQVIEALAHHRLAARFYAHEILCHKDILRFRDGAPCPLDYLRTPEECRRCGLEHLAPQIQSGQPLAWTQEYLAARAYAPEYHARTLRALKLLDAALVYNDTMKTLLEPWCRRVHIIPGGVDVEQFAYAPPPTRDHDKKVILMTGRAEDPAKGFGVLMEAAAKLALQREDFEVHVTGPEDLTGPAWFRSLGWREHASLPRLYARADVAVVPSIWDEPFGIVALEAMSVGRPVCASRVGGLASIVEHRRTGFLFERGDSAELARQLALLLDNADMRGEMSESARRRVEDEFTWERVVRGHYGGVLAHMAAQPVKAVR